MRCLVSAFEPFGGRVRNAASDCLDGASLPPGWERVVFPVCLPKLDSLVDRVLERPPRIWLALGESTASSLPAFELAARPAWDLTADSAAAATGPLEGCHPGPDLRSARLPSSWLQSELAALGHPLELSEDAGSHCCNALLWLVLSKTATWTRRPVAGFLHIPVNPASGVHSVAILEAAVGCLNRLFIDRPTPPK